MINLARVYGFFTILIPSLFAPKQTNEEGFFVLFWVFAFFKTDSGEIFACFSSKAGFHLCSTMIKIYSEISDRST